MVYALNLRMLSQPFGHLQAAFVVLTQANAQRADSAAGHVRRVGIHHLAHQIGVFTQLIPAARVGNRSTNHAVRVANQVFRRRLDGNINVEFQRFEQHACRPGVVDHNDRLWRFAAHGLDDSRHVVNFHGE